jgi:hypothetical protein
MDGHREAVGDTELAWQEESMAENRAVPTIRMSSHRHDMQVWMEEKANDLVWSLAQALDDIRRVSGDPAVSADALDDCLEMIRIAVRQSTKLLSFSIGSVWSDKDEEAVLQNGSRGYREVVARWGVQDLSAMGPPRLTLDEFRAELMPLLEGPRSNRTLVHELLREARRSKLPVERLEDLVECVTFGRLGWDEFRLQAPDELERMASPRHGRRSDSVAGER